MAFAAYAAAESVHGSGFLAAFAAGLTIAALDVDLCDCFLEYGQTTAELALLVHLRAVRHVDHLGGVAAASAATITFTAVALVIRPIAFFRRCFRRISR